MEHESTTTGKASFHKILRNKMDEYAHRVYAVTRKFPREELFGTTSQLRRAAISVMLNYIEGYARQRSKVHKNFLETAYGSLKESQYLLEFGLAEGYIAQKDYEEVAGLADEIGAMLWRTISKLS